MTMLTESQRAEWLEWRRQGIGGTDVAAILGVHPYETAVDVWRTKVDPEWEREESPRMKLGRHLESSVQSLYEEETGIRVTQTGGLRRAHKTKPLLRATLDGVIEPRVREYEVWEAKTVRAMRDQRDPETGLSMWGDPPFGNIPFHYWVQVQHSMAVTGYPRAQLAALDLSRAELRIYHIEASVRFHDEYLGRVIDWWDRYVVKRQPPPPATPDQAYARTAWLKDEVESRLADEDTERSLEYLIQLRAEKKELESRIAFVMESVQRFMADAGQLIDTSGRVRATWKTQKRKGIDVTKLRRENPGVAKVYEKESESRVFRIKETKEGSDDE